MLFFRRHCYKIHEAVLSYFPLFKNSQFLTENLPTFSTAWNILFLSIFYQLL